MKRNFDEEIEENLLFVCDCECDVFTQDCFIKGKETITVNKVNGEIEINVHSLAEIESDDIERALDFVCNKCGAVYNIMIVDGKEVVSKYEE